MCFDLSQQNAHKVKFHVALASFNEGAIKVEVQSLSGAPVSFNECAAKVGFDHCGWVSSSSTGLPPAKLVSRAGQLVSALGRLTPAKPHGFLEPNVLHSCFACYGLNSM